MNLPGQATEVDAATKAARSKRGARNRRAGVNAELRARDILEAMGYRVTRATGSLGDFDLAYAPTTLDSCPGGWGLVEVKTTRWPTGKALRRYLDAADAISGGRCEVWLRIQGKTGGPGGGVIEPVRWIRRDLRDWYREPQPIEVPEGVTP